MKSRVDYRLPATLLSLTLLGGSAVRGEEQLTDGALVTAPCPCNLSEARFRVSGLAFDFAQPVKCSCGATYTLCGHVCDGERCYETDDTAEGQPAAVELAADAKENLNFRIETREVAPPMPMLRTKQTSAVSEEAAPARCELGSPAEAVAADAATAYGPEMLEIVRLRCELDAAQQQLQTQNEHHEEVLSLLEKLNEAKTLAAEVKARQEFSELFCKNWGGLVEQHFKTIAERSVLQSKHDDVERLHESELEAVQLKAELAAAKEWISHRLAAEQSPPAPIVGYPYPLPPMFAPPGLIPAPFAVYEQQFVTADAEPASTARPWQRNPVPFAIGTYAPQESAVVGTDAASCPGTACAACRENSVTGVDAQKEPAAGSYYLYDDTDYAAALAKTVTCETSGSHATPCYGSVCSEESCNDCKCSDCKCSDCKCSTPSGTVLPGVVSTDGGVSGQIVIYPAAEAAKAEACGATAEFCESESADANVADRGEQSAESR